MPINVTPDAQTRLFDDFLTTTASTTWDFNEFASGGSFYGRTQQRQQLPTSSAGDLQLQLDTFADSTGRAFLGSEIISRQTFLPGSNGIAFEVRARLDTAVPGIVLGIFGYNFNSVTNLHDEIDFELLGNDASSNANRVQTNIYANQPLGAGDPIFEPDNGLTSFHTYRIEWRTTSVRWFIDGTLVREDTQNVPQGALALHMNIWAPASDWTQAYSNGLQPTNSATTDQTYTADVDYARVTQLAPLCFVLGTDIAVPSGTAPVETLRPGDTVCVDVDQRPMLVTWVGRREIDCTKHTSPNLVWPIRVSL